MIVTFGEVMARLASPGHLRLRQALPGPLEVTFAGAEANVAASVALLGGSARFVTALPSHPIADACIDRLRALGVDTGHIVRSDEGRLGLYFLETGANQRASQVYYDRADSSLALTPADGYGWSAALQGADWLHLSGITPALSAVAAEAAVQAAVAGRAAGLQVSCDLNFRKKLWRWSPPRPPAKLAGETMARLLPHVDVLLANEEDCHDVLGIGAGASDVSHGRLDPERYRDVASQVARRFPRLRLVAITLRGSLSASHNQWGAMLYQTSSRQAHFAPGEEGRYVPYEIRNIVDRVGAGDAFAGALIFALTTPELSEPASALRFATAASCLAHSISGDFNYCTRAEVEALVQGHASGRVVR